MHQNRRALLTSVGSCLGACALADALAPRVFSATLVGTAFAQSGTAPPSVPQSGAPFDAKALQAYAKFLAQKPFLPLSAALPDAFSNLTYDQYVSIRAKGEAHVWDEVPNGFSFEPLHRGFMFAAPMEIYTVEDGMIQRLAYQPGLFDFGKLAPNLPANYAATAADIGFSGFRLFQNRDGQKTEIAIFQGACFFRAIAYGQNAGIMARALSIRTADARGEEIPFFRAIYVEKPTYSDALTLHALLDSESVSGYFRFAVRPGDNTLIDTECALYPRVDLDHIGLAPMTATCLFNALDRRRSEDMRPQVSEISGLSMEAGAGEWLYRPIANRSTLQVSAFVDKSPKGFGLVQRARNFSAFEDDEQHFERRPSLFVEPISDFGEGVVTLIEIPSESETAQNIIAYWRPKAVLGAGVEANFSWRQNWCWTPPEKPALATVMAVRSGKLGKKRRFLVEFSCTDETLSDMDAEIKTVLNANPGASSNLRLYRNKAHKSLRVLFDLDAGSETYSEVRLVLTQNDKPISETWLYRWTP